MITKPPKRAWLDLSKHVVIICRGCHIAPLLAKSDDVFVLDGFLETHLSRILQFCDGRGMSEKRMPKWIPVMRRRSPPIFNKCPEWPEWASRAPRLPKS